MQQEMSVLGIDIAKRLFHAVGMDERGTIVFRKRLSRHDLIPFIGYPFSPGHFESSITYRDGLTALPGHGQLVDMR
jgi:hypothetical protein